MSSDASSETLPITSNDDVVRARQLVRNLALEARLTLVDQTKLVTAVSELARNTLIHGGGGAMEAGFVQDGARRGLRVRFQDSGPGIPDLQLALTDGWTTGDGLGLGLSGSRRLVDQFAVDTAPGVGTTVTITKWAR